MKILIAGASGFIGSHIAAHLHAAGHAVVAAARGVETARRRAPWLDWIACDFRHDRVEDWASPDAVLKRLDFASTLAERVGQAGRPRERAQAVLGERMSTDTALSISRAESAEQGLTLLFMSPEFQRR